MTGKRLVSGLDLLPWAVLAICGHVADVVSTFVGIEYFGLREGNPVLAPVLNSQMPLRYTLVGVLKMTLVSWNLHNAFSLRSRRVALQSLKLHTVAVWAVVAWNVTAIYQKRSNKNE